MMEAQRFPEDFDGVIAGDPSFGTLGSIRRVLTYQTLLSSPEHFLSPAKISLLASAVTPLVGVVLAWLLPAPRARRVLEPEVVVP